jgi:hypothetical protein
MRQFHVKKFYDTDFMIEYLDIKCENDLRIQITLTINW